MSGELLTLLILTTVFANGVAVLCYSRTDATATNGTVLNCTTNGSFCYSFSNYGSSGSFAGCSANTTCASPSCVFCTSDYCNSLTPSVISCYTRSSTSNTTNNGTTTSCASGISSCFTQFSKDYYAGCGNCTAAATSLYGCRDCNSSYCNTQTPSSISCYTRTSATSASSNGVVTACPTGATSCFSISTSEAACGPCTATAAASNGCLSCNTSNCNTRRQCYYVNGYRSDLYLTYRMNVTCNAATACYQYNTTSGFAAFYYSGCGACSTISSSGCRDCTTDYCNSMSTTATITTCYNRTSATASSSDGTVATCPDGISSCNAYNSGSAGCGSCTDSTGGCVSCSSSNCNTRRRCLSQSGSLYYYLASTVTCASSTSCYWYTTKVGSSTTYYSGCGVCSATGTDCQSCTANYCNSFATSSGAATNLSLRMIAAALILLTLMQEL